MLEGMLIYNTYMDKSLRKIQIQVLNLVATLNQIAKNYLKSNHKLEDYLLEIEK